MSETPIHAEDGSPLREEPKKERPFTHPMSAYGQRPDVDNSDGEGSESPQDPRMAIIEAAAQAADEDRMIAAGTRQEDMPAGEPVPDVADEEGLQHHETFGEGAPEEGGLPQEYAEDPLSEFIVMQDDEAMLRTVVDGHEQLIPLEKARATIQKNAAADRRLQEAAQLNKQLADREAAITAREAQIAARLEGMHETPPPAEADAGVDDETLEAEAREVVSKLFTGDENEAAAKLVKLLKDSSKGAKPATPMISPEALVEQAAAATRKQLSDEAKAKDIKDGYEKFVDDYPEIAADDDLFQFADSMSDKIAAEHPDWMPSQVMLEAGKRVRDWVKQQQAPEQSDEPTGDRQERKRKLRPMPSARQQTQKREVEEQPQTPADALAEIRASRGQVV